MRWALMLFVLAACGGPERWEPRRVDVAGAGPTDALEASASASLSPEARLDALREALGARGYERLGGVHRARIDAHGFVVHRVEARASRCYALVAIGDVPEERLDLLVLDPLGRPLGHDARPDNHPWVSLCTEGPVRLGVRVHAGDEGGRYRFAIFEGPGRRRVDLDPFFGAPPEPPEGSIPLDADAAARLGALERELAARSLERVVEPLPLRFPHRGRRELGVHLERGRCYTFAAFGGVGAVDVDLTLFDADGVRLAADQGRSRDARFTHCARATGDYRLRIRMDEGEGVAYAVAFMRAADVQQGGPVAVLRAGSTAALFDGFALVDADMRARGYERIGAPRLARLALGEAAVRDVRLNAGDCYAAVVVGEEGARLKLAFGVDEGAGAGPAASRQTVRLCPAPAETARFRVTLEEGAEQHVHALYRWPRGLTGPFGLEGLIYVHLAELTASLELEGFTPDPGFDPVTSELASGASQRHSAGLSAGNCYAFVAVGEASLEALELSLTDASGATRAEGELGATSLRHCAEVDGSVDIHVRAARGRGRYHHQVFVRAD